MEFLALSYVLAIECSTISGGVALSENNKIVAQESWDRQSTHGEFVVPAIDKVLKSAGIRAEQLSLLAVGIGPGRFTGVRVAINASRSVAYALNLPIVAMSSLRILCEDCPPSDVPVLTIANAHKNMVYAAAFKNRGLKWEIILEPQALSLEQLEAKITEPHICVGDGFTVYESLFSEDLRKKLIRRSELSDYPKVEVLAIIASRENPVDWTKVEPLYIRLSEAEEKLKARL
jgi:tRNA threonylcarbamoyladenosine biosynthesis protein TsaB